MIGAPVTFVVKNTFIDDVVDSSSDVFAAPQGLRRVRTEPTSTTATEDKDTDQTAEDNLTRLEEAVTLVPPLYQTMTDEHPREVAEAIEEQGTWEDEVKVPHCTAENEVETEAIEEQETREDEGKVPVSPLGSAAAAAAAAAEHERQHHCSSKVATPPASTMQRSVKPAEIKVEDEVGEHPGLSSTVTGDLGHEWLPRCFSAVETPPALAMQRTMEAAENEIKDEAVEEQPPLCSVVTDELWREWQPRCFSEAGTPPVVETDSATLESNMQVEQQPSPASLLSRQQEPPLNRCTCAQRTRDAQPTLKRVESIASNCIRVMWRIPEKMPLKTNKTIDSPDFGLWEGGTFKLVLRACPDNVKGGFHGSGGVGVAGLKFCGGTELARKVHYRVAAGQNKELSFQGLDHDFATRPQSTLQQERNFLSVVNQGSLRMHFEARMEERPA